MPAHPIPRPVHECHCGDHAWTPTNRGFVALVSPEDVLLLTARAWTAVRRSRTMYAQSRIRGQLFYLHRLIANETPETDHRNHWGLDNRRPNLRPSSRAENTRNTRPRQTTNRTSKFKGVHWSTNAGKWAVQIATAQSKTITLGHFNDEVEAARAYDRGAREHHGDFAYLNFPEAAE